MREQSIGNTITQVYERFSYSKYIACFNAVIDSLGHSAQFNVVMTPEPAGGEAHFVWIRAPDAPIPIPTRHPSAHVDLPQAYSTHWQATMNDVFDI